MINANSEAIAAAVARAKAAIAARTPAIKEDSYGAKRIAEAREPGTTGFTWNWL